MDQRGRKSTAALTAVGAYIARIEAPAELPVEQAVTFCEIVGSQAADFFNAGNLPLLVSLVRHIHEERRVGDLLANFDTGCMETEEGLRRYTMLARAHDLQSKAVVNLSRQLRLSNQARYRADKVHRAPQTLRVSEYEEESELTPS